MLSDVHMHTNFSGDCDTPAEKQIEQAIALGMKEICITDHHDYDVQSPTDFTLDIDAYLPRMKQYKEQYASRICVNIGIELGLQLHISDYLNALVQKYPFDFIIGSSHFIDGLDPYFPEYFNGKTEEEQYLRYFDVTLRRIQKMDCFDSFGHLDYVVRYGPNQNKYYNYQTYSHVIDSILKALIQKGKGLECNTGGYKYGLGHPNPTADVLRRYRELGGELLTVGSDAHKPEHIGYEFKKVTELLVDCGFRYYTVFHHRKPEFIKL